MIFEAVFAFCQPPFCLRASRHVLTQGSTEGFSRFCASEAWRAIEFGVRTRNECEHASYHIGLSHEHYQRWFPVQERPRHEDAAGKASLNPNTLKLSTVLPLHSVKLVRLLKLLNHGSTRTWTTKYWALAWSSYARFWRKRRDAWSTLNTSSDKAGNTVEEVKPAVDESVPESILDLFRVGTMSKYVAEQLAEWTCAAQDWLQYDKSIGRHRDQHDASLLQRVRSAPNVKSARPLLAEWLSKALIAKAGNQKRKKRGDMALTKKFGSTAFGQRSRSPMSSQEREERRPLRTRSQTPRTTR